MGIDYLDMTLRLEERFGVRLHVEDFFEVRLKRKMTLEEIKNYSRENARPDFTAGEVAEAIGNKLRARIGSGDPWTEDEVWRGVQRVVAETVQVEPAKVTRESRLVKDLGFT